MSSSALQAATIKLSEKFKNKHENKKTSWEERLRQAEGEGREGGKRNENDQDSLYTGVKSVFFYIK